MKNVFFALAFMLVGVFAFANNSKIFDEIISMNTFYAIDINKELIDQKASISFNSDKTDLKLDFDSFDDLAQFEFDSLSEVFESGDSKCSVTATVTVTSTYTIGGDIGIASSGQTITVSVSASVTASCSEIGGAVKKLTKELKSAIM